MSEAAALAKAVHGLDASRRVGWAKFFEMRDEADAAHQAAVVSLASELRMALQVQHHPRLHADDPLVVYASDLIASIEADPAGRAFVDAVRRHALRPTGRDHGPATV